MLETPQTEKEILSRLISGDVHAFEQVYHLYSPRLFGKLIKLVKSDSDAREILQDVFLILWQHRASIDPEKSFRSFIFKIAENKVYDFFRKVTRDKNRQSELLALSTENYLFIEESKSGDQSLAILQKAIDSLSPQRKQVFRLCKLEGKTYKEVSELLEISVSTISDHIVKGTKSIRDYFEKHKHSLALTLSLFLISW